MATLPTRTPTTRIVINVEPLTSVAFAPFGTAIPSPVPQDVTTIPALAPMVEQKPRQPRPQPANQNTALKTSPVSPLLNNYPQTGQSEGRGVMSIFSCFPRQNLYTDKQDGKLKLKVAILERHPFTTQTFCPFNHSLPNGKTTGERTYFVVVVAPTLQDSGASPANPPDLSKIRAFLAPVTADGDVGMAITYHAGTWHAPMVVLGERRIDFLVTQFANGRSEDDCQEVLVGSESHIVEVDVSSLGLEEAYLWKRAKL